jgi:hypothetical protein
MSILAIQTCDKKFIGRSLLEFERNEVSTGLLTPDHR